MTYKKFKEYIFEWAIGNYYIKGMIKMDKDFGVFEIEKSILDLEHKKITALFGVFAIFIAMATTKFYVSEIKLIAAIKFEPFIILLGTFCLIKIILWYRRVNIMVAFLEIKKETIEDKNLSFLEIKNTMIASMRVLSLGAKYGLIFYILYIILVVANAIN